MYVYELVLWCGSGVFLVFVVVVGGKKNENARNSGVVVFLSFWSFWYSIILSFESLVIRKL